MSVEREIEERLRPVFEAVADEIRQEMPNVQVNVFAYPVGTRTAYQAYSVCISCLLKDIAADKPDNVGLVVTVKHLTTSPVFEDADVTWDPPSGSIEAELAVHDVPYSSEELMKIESDVPILVTALKAALRRGEPR